VVERIVAAIGAASACRVIDHSMDPDHNRSVVTFIGGPDEIRKSALAGARAAVELIDLNKHEGSHPRIGAVDVIPVIPLSEVTMDHAVTLSHEIGRDIADQLNLPVYFCEESAIDPDRTDLAVIRQGGYEALKESGLTGFRAPDLGPDRLHPTAGAVVVGARGPLIAYNVNLATGNIGVARDIAARIRALRESGQGMIGVKAIAVYLASRGLAQVSTNIAQPDKTGIHDVYAFVEDEARSAGVEVLESELIGALRQSALVDAVRTAMKLRDLTQERVLDYWMA
jgi:glutamate formiminotransferase